jgi:hypothetical protein
MRRNDWRLKFVNLKEDSQIKNIVGDKERSLLWIPSLVFGNSVKESQIKMDSFSTLIINRVSNATTRLNNFLQTNELFD